jgi:uncharacterized membrane protein AbrB (regulator of aidB expression)
MPTARQFCMGLVAADVVLFLAASAFNDHSNTSVDGIIWWAAFAVFACLIVIAMCIMGRFAWTRARIPKSLRGRLGRPG